ncbi:hypothetical protein FOL47_004253 [Perkinsus chesapeaki]|uniref:Nudix hydrolase domain-containing protein n=1 Tax=Perkinsus chesapeaki TaxID=330153 RepID=A0A7J6M4Q8_PERCH|nr:hypothetical protein FOL47_004253 [Perkinsus chesapeaki]
MPTTTVSQLASLLAQQKPVLSAARMAVKSRAMVACIVRAAPRSPGTAEMLLIRRAVREGDPWSGQTAFPGGRCEPKDYGSDLATAIREANEEIGVDLSDERHFKFLGRINDIELYRSGRVHMVVGCMVFHQLAPQPIRVDPLEVAACGWVPLSVVGQATSGDLRIAYWSVPKNWGLPSYLHNYLSLIGLNEVALATLPIDLQDAVKANPDVKVDDLDLWGLTLQFAMLITRDPGDPLVVYRNLPVCGLRVPHKYRWPVHDLGLALYHTIWDKARLRHGSAVHVSYFCFFHCLLAAVLTAVGVATARLRSRL